MRWQAGPVVESPVGLSVQSAVLLLQRRSKSSNLMTRERKYILLCVPPFHMCCCSRNPLGFASLKYSPPHLQALVCGKSGHTACTSQSALHRGHHGVARSGLPPHIDTDSKGLRRRQYGTVCVASTQAARCPPTCGWLGEPSQLFRVLTKLRHLCTAVGFAQTCVIVLLGVLIEVQPLANHVLCTPRAVAPTHGA